MNTLLTKVKAFAFKAHAGQTRKYTGDSYITHPLEVARIVASVEGHTEEMLAAALLHDTIEDCGVHQHQIDQLFGETVGTYVMWLTDNEKGNRAERKAQSRARLAAAPAEVQTIKLADLISNTASIVEHDPKFAKVYLQEKMELLSVLIKGDDWLHRRAQQQVADGLESLEQAKAA